MSLSGFTLLTISQLGLTPSQIANAPISFGVPLPESETKFQDRSEISGGFETARLVHGHTFLGGEKRRGAPFTDTARLQNRKMTQQTRETTG
jgi:hypothetical protein